MYSQLRKIEVARAINETATEMDEVTRGTNHIIKASRLSSTYLLPRGVKPMEPLYDVSEMSKVSCFASLLR